MVARFARLACTLVLAACSLAPASGLLSGCAEERPAIDRVQPYALPKSFFVGADLRSSSEGRQDDPEFYYRATVIDVGYGASQQGLFTATWAQPLSRITWEITEDYLNARLSFELVEGADGKGSRTTRDGQLVASFAVESHFDIVHAYNPTTGEQLNVLEENTTDRPWYQREYLRVDWSQNLITDVYAFDTLAQMGIKGGVEYEPLSYTVLDPDDEHAPAFEIDGGYFDITNQVFAKPDTVDMSSLGWGGAERYPACWLPPEFSGGTQPTGNCNPVELTLRLSFRLVEDTDYEPFNIDGVRFQAFGNFSTEERHGFERNYGLVDERWYRLAARYNLWKRSHYYDDSEEMTGPVLCATIESTEVPTGDPAADPNRDEDNDGTADECAAVTERTGVAGSQCDVFKRRCTLPYRLRQELTIPLYVGGDTGQELFEPTEWAMLEWDAALKSAVAVSRQVECERTGGEDCATEHPMWTGLQQDQQDAAWLARELSHCRRTRGWESQECVDEVFAQAERMETGVGVPEVVSRAPVMVLCHNPVTADDHAACGDEGLWARLGDLRYHSVHLIPTPQTPSPWGIMVDCDDPLTGEKVAASINIWTHVTDRAAQSTVDLIRYINGELETSDVTNGEHIRRWTKGSRLAPLPLMRRSEVMERLAASTNLNGEQLAQLTAQGVPADIQRLLRPVEQVALGTAMRTDIPSPHRARVQARARAARGSAMEAALLNPAMLQRAGVSGATPLQGALAEAASPLSGLNNPRLVWELRQMRENALAARGACVLAEAPEASGLTGMADLLRDKFPFDPETETAAERRDRVESMHRYIRRRFHYAVIAHEMGHSVGHRHNFVSSWASFGFRPQYWQLRTRNGAEDQVCSGPTQDGSECVGPRYYDPITEQERRQVISMFEQSSVMDYPGDLAQDMVGLGAWDWAAARFFYTDIAPVLTREDIRVGTPMGDGMLGAMDNFGGLRGIVYGIGDGSGGYSEFHYSEMQRRYTLIDECHATEIAAPSWWDESVDGLFHPTLDALLVEVDGELSKCRDLQVDYVAWKDLGAPDRSQVATYVRASGAVDTQGRIRVPLGFATDHWADTGNVSVFRHDAGADPYEQVMYFITTKETRHIFENYRRGRADFSVRKASERTFERYLTKMLNAYGGVGFFANIYRKYMLGQGVAFETVWPFIVSGSIRDNMLAATLAFDHFTRELFRPEDGPHFLPTSDYAGGVLVSAKDADGNAGTDVIIPNGTTGYLRDVGLGGRPIENALVPGVGDFRTQYTANAGSYYDKIAVAILMTESEDRFVSESRGDFDDARFRAAGYADTFPDGVRRVLANALTNDDALTGAFLAARRDGLPLRDRDAADPEDPWAEYYPAGPLGWTSWWPTDGPEICFPSEGESMCASYATGTLQDGAVQDKVPEHVSPLSPQVGWEVKKFLIAWSLLHVTDNQMRHWVDMMRIYRVGEHAAPAFEQRVEWQCPESGDLYYARTYGTEMIHGRQVQKGIAARVLEYANSLTEKGYLHTGRNAYGRVLVVHQPDGTPVVAADPVVVLLDERSGRQYWGQTCDQNEDPECQPLPRTANRYATELTSYKSVPDFLLEAVTAYGLGDPEQLGFREL